MGYTGVPARRLGRTDRQLVLQPGQRETLQVRVSWDEYRDKVVDYGMIKIYALASVAETKQTWSEEDDFQLEKPKLDVQVCRTMNSIQKNVRGAAQVGQDCFVTFSFLNPLSVNLTECEFTFEGPGLVHRRPSNIVTLKWARWSATSRSSLGDRAASANWSLRSARVNSSTSSVHAPFSFVIETFC